MSQNIIGLNQDNSNHTIEQLNQLLATYQIFYMNVRGYHWNVKGEHFFGLHEKFELLYTELVVQIDDIAERILTLGGTPLHAYSDYASASMIAEDKNKHNGRDCAKAVLAGLSSLLTQQRNIITSIAEYGDEGTVGMLSEYVQIQEKHVWMYNAFLQQ